MAHRIAQIDMESNGVGAEKVSLLALITIELDPKPIYSFKMFSTDMNQ